MSERAVHCADALSWLASEPLVASRAFVTSMPDVSEVGLSLADWKAWFERAALAILEKVPPDGVGIFFQTDIKQDGLWVDKAHLIQRAADTCQAELLWHRIACRLPPGTYGQGRPSYSHVLCFSRGHRPAGVVSMPDVLADAGEKLWVRGIGWIATAHAIRFVRRHTPCHTVVDPFCGKGTFLAAANAAGLDAIGVDLSPARCRNARSLSAVPAVARALLDRA